MTWRGVHMCMWSQVSFVEQSVVWCLDTNDMFNYVLTRFRQALIGHGSTPDHEIYETPELVLDLLDTTDLVESSMFVLCHPVSATHRPKYQPRRIGTAVTSVGDLVGFRH